MVSPKKIEDIAFSLPLFGVILIVPPIINVFSVDRTILGVPFFVIYIFAVWIALIFLTFSLSKKLPTRGVKTDDAAIDVQVDEPTSQHDASAK